ncbi:uncharacterized protein LOC131217319 [Magnolia sinica]|uniref:uncharacterized protein LOC131217319 n=1 Tax=Magnolia sinica TaxID=86752 RepID=UPI00265AEDD4|nr:uncharacterized protein LOC131217319 [Magnolia sinica]
MIGQDHILLVIPSLVTQVDNTMLLAPPTMLEVHRAVQPLPTDGAQVLFSPVARTSLSQLLPSLISPEQGTFIQGRSISENIALAQELFKELNKKSRGGNIVLKLDMEKAYDREEWSFLKQIPVSRVRTIERILRIAKSSSPLSYPGVPVAAGRLKASFFQPLIWNVGAGNSNLWSVNWTGLVPLQQLTNTPVPAMLRSLKVNEFLNVNGPRPPSAIFNFLPLGVVDHIFQGAFYISEGQDTPFWPFTPSGCFSVKSAWAVGRMSSARKDWTQWVWHAKLPPRISLFVWKMLHKAIPVEEAVQAKGIQLASKCVCCADGSNLGPSSESIKHLFLESGLDVAAWNHFGVEFGINIMAVASVEVRLMQWWNSTNGSKSFSLIHKLVPCFLIWELWKTRNAAYFDCKNSNPAALIRLVSWWMSSVAGPAGVTHSEHAMGLHLLQSVAPRNPGKAGGGGVCRNDKGELLFAFYEGYREGSNLYAELRAVYDGLFHCLKMGFSNVIVESDSQLVVEVMNGSDILGYKWRYWTTRINRLWTIGQVHFQHIFKQGNAPTDFLARVGNNSQSPFFCSRYADLPLLLRGLLFLDKVGLGSVRER